MCDRVIDGAHESNVFLRDHLTEGITIADARSTPYMPTAHPSIGNSAAA
jgi:hypothetical protein